MSPAVSVAEPATANDASLAMHGFSMSLPGSWDLVATRGDWQAGHLLLAQGRAARLSVQWSRSPRSLDLARSQRRLCRSLEKSFGVRPVHQQALGQGGMLIRCVGDDTDLHAAIAPLAGGLTLVLADAAVGHGRDELLNIANSLRTAEPAGPVAWQFYGLRCALPPTYRMVGVADLSGLTRAVWFGYNAKVNAGSPAPVLGTRVQQVLILRRYALADHVLAGRSLAEWLRSSLARRERVDAEEQQAGTLRMLVRGPAATWWRRLRGIAEERTLHAWIEEDSGRLVVQEWRGSGPALPALRWPHQTQAAPFTPGRLAGADTTHP